MNRSTLRVTCAVLAAGLVGYGIGHWQRSPAGTPATTAGGELATLRAHNAALRAELARRSAQTGRRNLTVTHPAPTDTPLAAAADQQVAARLNELVDAKKRNLALFMFPVLDEQGHLDAKFIGLFGLSPAETRSMQSAFDAAQEQMNQLTAANTTLNRQGDTFVASVQPFDGSAVYDGLMDQASRVLGTQRYAAFAVLCDEGISEHFARYGAEERTVSVQRVKTSGAGSVPMLRIEDSYDAGGRRGRSGSFVSLNALPLSVAWLAPYVSTFAHLPVEQLPPFPGKH